MSSKGGCLALQDTVALAVAGKIEPALEQAEIRRAATRPTDKVGAYDRYLRALPLFRTFGRTEVFKASELLNQAIAMDGDFAPALAMAVSCPRTIIIFGWSQDPERDRIEALALARRTCRRRATTPRRWRVSPTISPSWEATWTSPWALPIGRSP